MKNRNFSSTKRGGWLVTGLNCTNAPNQLTNGRLLITSKKIEPVVIRRPVKECYCNAELFTNQLRRPKRTQTKPRCKSRSDLESDVAWSPLSCETLSKVQSIVYSPRSKFLRSKLFRNEVNVDPLHSPNPSRCKQSFSNPALLNPRSSTTKPKMPQPKCTRCTMTSSPKKQRSKSNKKPIPKQVSSYAKSVAISSPRRCPSKGTRVSAMKSPLKRASTACTLCRKFSCPGCSAAKTRPSPRLNNVEELYRFRKDNYSETHGSRCSLDSSNSGSLVQYLLNERLFPQPASKVHRGDVMLTVPASLTKQNKRIHYFPRYLVDQNGPCRGQRCPLTGHAIDIGLLKRTHLPNSLALRYQKLVS